MGIRTICICDECDEVIPTDGSEDWIDATVYGIVLHMHCLTQMSALRLMTRLDLDDIYIRKSETDDHSRKAIRELRSPAL